jgi:oxalate---CoA ligase
MASAHPGSTDPGTTGVWELIRRRAAEHPHRPFLEDARSDRVIDYATAAAIVGGLRTALLDRGVRTAFIDIRDPLVFAVSHLSAIASGSRSVPIDPSMQTADLAALSGRVGDGVAVVTPDPARAEAAGALHVAPPVIDGAHASAAPPEDAAATGRGSVMLFTSGSTGAPKGVELTEDQLLFVAAAVARHLELSPEDRGYNSLPLFHINAEVVGLLGTLTAGATLVLDERFHRTGFWSLMTERRITWINAVPAILAVLATGEIAPPAGLRFIRSASAPLPAPVADAYEGIPLVVSYGMTEASSQITATPLRGARAGTVGIPVGTQVQPRRDDGSAAPADEVGELWIRGDGVVSQYFAGAAADRFDGDGWLRTGDLGSVDADGFVTLTGRVDDVINRGGEKLYPLEIEEVLLAEAGVREAVVVGSPHDVLGAVPVAFVIPADPADAADPAALVARLEALAEARLPRFKRPTSITVVEDLPRAATGKVQRVRLREGA